MIMIENLKRKGLMLGIVFCFLVVCIVLLFLQSRSSNYVIRTSSQTVIKEMQKLNRLETASFTIEKVIEAGTTGNQFQQVLFGDRVLLIAHGKVIAGIDLSKLSENDVVVSGTTLKLTLPAPEILFTTIDNKETRVYDRRQGLLTKGDTNLESEARRAAESTIRDAACTGGILKEASTNATSQLTALFKTMQFSEVVITSTPGSC